MESIRSLEKFGRPSIGSSEAPVHTPPEHRECAYYISETLHCVHGEAATGAFYNEDYVNELRRTSHELIAAIDTLIGKAHYTNANSMISFQEVWPSDLRKLRDINNLLRMLTK